MVDELPIMINITGNGMSDGEVLDLGGNISLDEASGIVTQVQPQTELETKLQPDDTALNLEAKVFPEPESETSFEQPEPASTIKLDSELNHKHKPSPKFKFNSNSKTKPKPKTKPNKYPFLQNFYVAIPLVSNAGHLMPCKCCNT